MGIFEYLKYRYLCLLYPKHKDFIKAGFGISERYHRCQKYWAPHLSLTKSFITSSLNNNSQKTVSILGAGHLFDVPLEALSEISKKIILMDYDPGSLNSWRKAKRYFDAKNIETKQYLLDITGHLESITSYLHSLDQSSSLEEVLPSIESVFNNNEKITKVNDVINCSDLVISLNLLSQIPLYVEDRIISSLTKLGLIAKIREEEQLPSLVVEFLRRISESLQKQHLALLNNCGAETILLITDQLFHYYKPGLANWQTESAIAIDLQASLPCFTLENSDSWLWHLAPSWLEDKHYGEIHKVLACNFRRLS